MPLTTTYAVPVPAVQRLDTLVAAIARNPGRMVDPVELAALQQRVDIRPAFAALPASLSDDDFVGVLKLALLTECATDSYAAVIEDRAARYDAGRLGRFTRDVWVPDERMHHAPYRAMLLRSGFTERELDAEIAETQARTYVHHSGDTPIHITAFGMVQACCCRQTSRRSARHPGDHRSGERRGARGPRPRAWRSSLKTALRR